MADDVHSGGWQARRTIAGVGAVWLAYQLYAFSGAGLGRPVVVVAWAGGAVLLGGWVAAYRSWRRHDRSLARRALEWTAPATCLLVAALFLFGKPPHNPLFHLRFRASREALTEQAGGVLIVPPPAGEEWIGLFRARVEVGEHRVWFLTPSCADGHRCGLVYAPGTRPPGSAPAVFTRLGGPWYHFDQPAR